MKKNLGNQQNSKKNNQEKKINKFSFTPRTMLGGIILLVIIIYSNAMKNDILNFDDIEYFTNYPEVLSFSLKSLKEYFSNYYVIMYQPLPVLSFALNYHFSQLHTLPLHLVNLCFHIFNILLVYQFIKLLTENKTLALLIALLFAIHPMNVEAVSWISARSSSLYTFFYLFGLVYYLKYLNSDYKLKYILITALFFVFSLFSKAQAVTFPVVLVLIDYFKNRKLLSLKTIAEKIPFLIGSICIGIVTLMDTGTQSNLTTGMIAQYNGFDIFFIVCYSFMFYLFKFILPVNLCSIYVYPPKDGAMLPMQYYLSALVIVAVIYFVYKIRNNKPLIFALGLFFATIAINIQIIPSRLFVVTDRYSYFPYIGLFLFLFFGLNYLKENKSTFYMKYQHLQVPLLLVYVCFFSISVYSRNIVWQNDVTLMTDIINKNYPTGYITRAYGIRGLAYKQANEVQNAINDFTEGIKLQPNESRNYVNRALTYMMTEHNNEEALNDFTKALDLEKQPIIYSYRSQLRFTMNDLKGSADDCYKCLALDSTNVDAYNTLAFIDFKNNDTVSCEKHLDKAIHFKPDFAVALKNRGTIYSQTNRIDLACKDWSLASDLGNRDATSLFIQNCK